MIVADKLESCQLESYPENSGHPVGYYCRCQCLGSSHMVIARLVQEVPLCGIGCRQILEMRRLFSKNTPVQVDLTDKYLISFNSLPQFLQTLFAVLLYYIVFVQRL